MKIQHTLKLLVGLTAICSAVFFGQRHVNSALMQPPQCTPTPTPSSSSSMLPFAYYKLDETSGQTVANATGTGNGVANGTTIISGKLGNARLLNNSTSADYLSLGDGAQFNGADRIAVSGWVNLSQQTGQQAFITKWGTNAGTFWTDFNEGVPRTAFQAGGWITADVTIPTGSWHHIAWVYDGTASDNKARMKLYVDGSLRKLNFGTASVPTTLASTTAPVMVGSYNTGGNFLLKGAVDEISLWNQATLDGQIVNLYNNNQGRAYEDLLRIDNSALPFSYYKLDETCGSTITDERGANAGVANGTTIVSGKLGNARSFDGVTSADYLSFGNVSQFNNAQKLSVGAWVKLTDKSGQQAFITKWGTNAGTFWTDFNEGVPRTAFQAGGWITATNFEITVGSWHHVVWAYDGTAASNEGRIRLYVDGVRRPLTFGTASVPATLASTTAPVMVGSYNTGGSFLLKGAVDEISFWSKPATDALVSNLYNDDPLSSTPNNNPGRGLSYEAMVRAARLHSLSIVVEAHTHDFTYTDLLAARTGGVTALTAKLTVEGVDWAGGTRCYLDAYGNPGAVDPFNPNAAIPSACLQLPGGWRNRFLYYLNQVKGTATQHSSELLIIHDTNDILAAKATGKLGVVLGSESGLQLTEQNSSGALVGNPDFIQEYYDAGWRETQLHWSSGNSAIIAAGASCSSPDTSGCLTDPFGHTVVEQATSLGILIDVSHTIVGVQDIIDRAAPAPVIISHDSPKQLFNFKDTMTDATMQAVAASGNGYGVIAMHFYDGYYSSVPATYDPLLMDNFLKGLDYVKTHTSARHVALGPDYFPENNSLFVTPVTDTSDIALGLVRLGYSDEEIQRILGQNMLDLYGRVWK
jgi:membrane dipeptidase